MYVGARSGQQLRNVKRKQLIGFSDPKVESWGSCPSLWVNSRTEKKRKSGTEASKRANKAKQRD